MGRYDSYRRKVSDSLTDSEYSSCLIADSISSNFFQQPNYITLYKNYNYVTQYDALLINKKSEQDIIMDKYLIMYDSQTIETGEYVHFKYAENPLSTWIVIGEDRSLDYAEKGHIKKTNWTLKWVDENDVIQEWDMVYENIGTASSGIDTKNAMDIMDYSSKFIIQKNDDTLKLFEGQRIIVGTNVYKIGKIVSDVQKGNIFGFLLATEKNLENDNFTLGIADYYNRKTYTIENNISTLDSLQSTAIQLSAVVKDNLGTIVDKSITWTSSTPTLATVNSSGLVNTLTTNGIVDIISSLTDNPDIYDVTTINISASTPTNYEFVLSPNITSLRLTESKIINVKLYNNGIEVADTLTITVDPTTTSLPTSYTFSQIDNNNFSVKNINGGGNLVIKVTGLLYTDTKTIQLKLGF